MSLVSFGLIFYVQGATGYMPVWATRDLLITEAVNLGVTSILVWVIGGLRLAPPVALARMVSSKGLAYYRDVRRRC